MTCNGLLDAGSETDNEQDEWTPYTTYSYCYTRELHSLSSVDYPSSKRNELKNYMDVSTIFKQNFCPREDSLLETSKFTVNACACIVPSGKLQNKCNVEKYKCYSDQLQIRELWDRIVDNCHVEKRICWQDSLENICFQQSLGISYKENPVFRDHSKWTFKCHGCHGKRFEKESDILNELDDSEDKYSSPCCCPKYYHISEHGVVFNSYEEKQIFQEKMAKMDDLLKSELRMIREQHNRLQQIAVNEKNEESMEDIDEELLELEESRKSDEPNINQGEMGLNEEIQERSKPSTLNGLKELLNNFNFRDVSDSPKEPREETTSSKIVVPTDQLYYGLLSTLKEMEVKLE